MLLGRAQEKAVLGGLIDGANNGLSGALILYGEAGMGKTALLDYAAEATPTLQLLRIAGIEAEQDFSFSALHRLLQPLLNRLDKLPAPQSDALRSAFGIATHSPADLFLIGLATLTLLADVASERPLLCIVDDSQWIDSESLHVLAFAGRRLGADRIILLFGLRSSTEITPILAGLSSLEVSGLPAADAYALLSTVVAGPLDVIVAHRIIAETSGCPLALIELANELSAEQWVGVDRISEPIPISRRLEEHFHRQVEALSPTAQTFVLMVAAEASGDISLVRRAAQEVGCGRDDEAEAVRARLLTVASRIQFRHPLIRSATYTGASVTQRRLVHAALASAIDRDAEPDRWAQHVAAITTGYDEQLAADLEAGANRARDRGGCAAEASLLAQAAGFTQNAAIRSKRLLQASGAALNADAPERARGLFDEACANLKDPWLKAQALYLDGRLHRHMMQMAKAPALFLAAAQRFDSLDIDSTRLALFEAMDSYLAVQYFVQDTDSSEIAAAALTTRPSDSPRRLSDAFIEGTGLLVSSRYTDAIESLRHVNRRITDGSVPVEEIFEFPSFAMVADELWDERAARSWAEKAESLARKQGALLILRLSLVVLASTYVRAGQFMAADACFAESIELTAAGGSGKGALNFYRALNVTLLAWRGDVAGTRAAAKQLIEMGEGGGLAVAQFQAYHALAILALGAGRYAEALTAAKFCTDRTAIGWKCHGLPIVVEAGLRSGDRDAATQALEEITSRATATATPLALGILARAQALMADDTQAEDLYHLSIGYLQQTLVVTDLASAYLSYGEWLRRRQRRVDARVQLRKAYEAFEAMGAAGFAERARSELLATGERVSQRTVGVTNNLTPQELKIAQLASRGATNPEIAAQMFISTSTVDYHLRKIYRKLGISSRRQLERALSA